MNKAHLALDGAQLVVAGVDQQPGAPGVQPERAHRITTLALPDTEQVANVDYHEHWWP